MDTTAHVTHSRDTFIKFMGGNSILLPSSPAEIQNPNPNLPQYLKPRTVTIHVTQKCHTQTSETLVMFSEYNALTKKDRPNKQKKRLVLFHLAISLT